MPRQYIITAALIAGVLSANRLASRAEEVPSFRRDSDRNGTFINCSIISGCNGLCSAGDCNRDGRVTVDEILLCINIVLGTQPAERCQPVEAPDRVDISFLTAAVDNLLNGCR